MKADILKHTGLTEAQFYAKYKTKADFDNSKEGKAFFRKNKIAQSGKNLPAWAKVNMPDVQGMAGPTPGVQAQNYPAEGTGKPSSSSNPGAINQMGDTDRNGFPDLLEPNTAAVHNTFGPKNSPYPTTQKSSILKNLDPTGVTNAVTGIADSVSQYMEEGKQAKEATMWHGVTDVQLAASKTKPEMSDQKYVRPEDQIVANNQLRGMKQVGTNPIAQDGFTLPGQASDQYGLGNPTEIANNFAPYDIYSDPGYEPLNDSNLKKFAGGGMMDALSGPINSGVNSIVGGANAGTTAGGAIGGMANMIFPGAGAIVGPAASLILGGADKLFGPAGDIAREQKATTRNVNQMQGSQMAASVQAGLASHMQNGGNTNPQVLKYFGEHSLKDLLKPDPMMNTLQGGGEIQTHWGGEVYPDSYNPYMGGSGITYNSRGQSHHDSDSQGRTGIGISVNQDGGNVGEVDAEIEAGEPINGNIVYGNLYANMMGDPKYKNQRIKNIVTKFNKKEEKHNKALGDNTKRLADPDLDPLGRKTAEMIDLGNNMSLKSIAEEKQKFAALQTAINSTRDEISDSLGYKISAEQLSKDGSIVKDKDPVTKIARHGAILNAQNGLGPRKFKSEQEAINAGFRKNDKGMYVKAGTQGTKKMSKQEKANALEFARKGQHKKDNGLYGDVTPEQYEATKAANPWFDWKNFDPGNEADTDRFQRQFNDKAKSIGSVARIKNDKLFGEQTASARLDLNQEAEQVPAPDELGVVEEPLEEKKPNWWDVLGAVIPHIRPSNAKALNPNQLMGEMYALSNNQVEPVRAQGIRTHLDDPQDISLQDQLNQVTSQTRSAQRLAGYNPAAQAAIAGQSYEPANRILGEQFRLNQAEKQQVYTGNRNKMDAMDLKNLEIYANQADNISKAVSNTKLVNKLALDSISEKYAENNLQNKRLQTYENLYNYRYGPNMRAYNMNPLYNPNLPQVYDPAHDDDYLNPNSILSKKTEVDKAKVAKESAVARNGALVKSLKRM